MTYADKAPRCPAPHTLPVEQALIGSLLLDPASIGAISRIVQPQDFVAEAHAIIFGTMLALHARGAACDYLALADELAWRQQLEGVGGRSYLLEVAAAVPLGVGAMQYALMVAQQAAQRRAESGGDAGDEPA
jgi:replicative DNA helicase